MDRFLRFVRLRLGFGIFFRAEPYGSAFRHIKEESAAFILRQGYLAVFPVVGFCQVIAVQRFKKYLLSFFCVIITVRNGQFVPALIRGFDLIFLSFGNFDDVFVERDGKKIPYADVPKPKEE